MSQENVEIVREGFQRFSVGKDQIVVPLRWGGKGKGSGLNFEESQETWIFTVRNAKIVRVTEFATRKQALKAAGLSE